MAVPSVPSGAVLFAGCYERFDFAFDVAGLYLPAAAGAGAPGGGAAGIGGAGVLPAPPALLKLMSTPAHLGPVKCVAAAGGFAVSGGSDDVIRVFDLRTSQVRETRPRHHSPRGKL